MKVLKLFLVFLLLAGLTGLISSDDHWQQFVSNNDVTALAWDGVNPDLLWIGTNGGLLRYNVVTGSTTLFNPLNSGLPSNEITAIVVAEDDNVWIGTANEGLVKYDGIEFTQLESPSRIRKLQFDEYGVLWILTKTGGPYPFYERGGSDENDSNQLMAQRILFGSYDMDVVASDNIWASLWRPEDFVLKHFDGEVWTYHYYYSQPIQGIQQATDDYIWVVKRDRIEKFLDMTGDWTTYDDLPVSNLNSVYIDQDNIKWFGGSGGLLKYDDEQWIYYNLDNSQLQSNRILSMLEDRNSAGMWIGTGKGLAFFDGAEFEEHDINVSGLLSNDIRDGIVDGDGIVWLATDRGICKYDGYTFTEINRQSSPLTTDSINALETDADGRIWIGTMDGLFSYDDGLWQHYTSDNSFLLYNSVYLLELDLNNNLYVYVNDEVYYRAMADPLTYIFYNPYGPWRSVLPNRNFDHRIHQIDLDTMEEMWSYGSSMPFISVLTVDQNNNIWFNNRDSVGLGGNIYFWDNLYRRNLSGIHSILQGVDLIYALQAENEGLWIGTGIWPPTSEAGDYSLFYLEDGQIITNYNIHNSDLPHHNVRALLIEGDTFWIGTQAGIARIVGDTWEIFHPANAPLPSEKVIDMFIDAQARIWIVIDKGLAVYGQDLVVQEETAPEAPSISLYPAYPNPFRVGQAIRSTDAVNIRYEIRHDSQVKLEIFNIKGQHVITLQDDMIKAGEHIVSWNGRDHRARTIPSGVYLYRLSTEDDSLFRKMMILR